jgi:putative tryptophan/tyrosine transport system substrate-binding protein
MFAWYGIEPRGTCPQLAGSGDRSMRRREFLTHLTGALLAWPTIAAAQAPNIPVIGFLNPGTQRPFSSFLAAFHKGLNAAGFVEGRNVLIEYRWAEGEFSRSRLSEQAAGLVRRRVTLIVATGGTASAVAAKQATDTIPILFIGGADPVSVGLVSSLARPTGNATGVSVYTSALIEKRLELLGELVPAAKTIVALANPEGVVYKVEEADLKSAAEALGIQLLASEASSESGIEKAFVYAEAQRAGAMLVSADPFFTSKRTKIVELAAIHRLPVAYPWREYVVAGGLMSYGPSITEAYRQIGEYAGRILRGAKPQDLPVQMPTRFEAVINKKTAQGLGLEIPVPLLIMADEVIE